MKITVIIPTYKPGEYIYECLKSITTQTLGRNLFEVIIVLNGCCEPWLSQLKDFVGREMMEVNVFLIHSSLGGVSNARNLAMNRAKGNYITFIDDDDFISPCYLEALLEKASPQVVVLADSRSFVDGTSIYNESYKQHQVYMSCSQRNNQSLLHARAIFNGPCMKLLPISFVQGEMFDSSLANGEDSLFMFQISKHIKRLAYASPSAIYYRRLRENSAVTRKKTIGYSFHSTINILNKYMASWLKSPLHYNLPFFLTRILAAHKNFVIDALNWFSKR